MKALLEMHILQNFSPSNLNRDDTNSPKDAFFGGFRRARVSSQCLKRAMRTYVKENRLLPEGNLAQRTKRLLDAVITGLQAKGHGADESRSVAEYALGGLGLKLKETKTEYLLFLGDREIVNITEAIEQNWAALTEAIPATTDEKSKGKSAKEQKKEAKASVPDDIKKALGKAMRDRGAGGDAVDLALFGRMLADKPEKNQDAACQVAHALSTHRVDREFDFYTAVDDRKPEDTAGADMLGTVEFNSACYYRYLNIDLELLRTNLQNDPELIEKGLEAFLRAAVLAIPTGKQNSHAAHNPPSFVSFSVRTEGAPRNLANAFVKPARPGELSLVEHSLQKLQSEWQRLDEFLGSSGQTFYWNGSDHEFGLGDNCKSCNDLVTRTVSASLQALGQ